MKKCNIICLCLLVMLALIGATSNAQARQKSSVLVVFNDQSGRDSGERLRKIAHETLYRKVEGLYNVIESKPYEEKLNTASHMEDTVAMLCESIQDSNADYFVYVELLPFQQAEGFDLIWHSKKMTANLGLKILNSKEGKEIFQETYSVEKEDDTDFFIVGSPSMARKSLKGALFTAGEAISVHLPL